MDRVVEELRIIFTGTRNTLTTTYKVVTSLDYRFWQLVLVYLVAGVVFCWLMAMIPQWQRKAYLSQSKQNLHAVQLALERWAVDSPGGNYPARLEVLAEEGYMPVMPENPFTRRPMEGRVYADWDYAAANPHKLGPGNFGYVPKVDYRTTLSQEDLAGLEDGDIIGYELVLYW